MKKKKGDRLSKVGEILKMMNMCKVYTEINCSICSIFVHV